MEEPTILDSNYDASITKKAVMFFRWEDTLFCTSYFASHPETNKAVLTESMQVLMHELDS